MKFFVITETAYGSGPTINTAVEEALKAGVTLRGRCLIYYCSDDEAVFRNNRGYIDALPGSKTELIAALASPPKVVGDVDALRASLRQSPEVAEIHNN